MNPHDFYMKRSKERPIAVNFDKVNERHTIAKIRFDQRTPRDSVRPLASDRTLSNKKSSDSMSLAMDPNKTVDDHSNAKKNSALSRCKYILIGLFLSLLVGGVALGAVTTMWRQSSLTTTTVTTTSTSLTSSTSSSTSSTSSTSSSTSSTSSTSSSTSSTSSTSSSTSSTSSTSSSTSSTSSTSSSTSSTTSVTTTASTTTTSVTTSTTTTTETTTTNGALIYSESFSSGVTPTTQCTAWTNFVAQLTGSSYTLLQISGTLDPIGITISDPTVIAGIALALSTSTSYGPVTSNGRSWMVGSCGGGYELSASGSICACPSPDYIVRPCIGNSNYGGVNDATCGGSSQTMTVIFQ